MHFSSPQTQYLNMTDLSIGIAVYLLYVLNDLARYSKCVTVSLYQYMFQFLQKHFSFCHFMKQVSQLILPHLTKL